MKAPFMSYYEHIAKLSLVANKQTLFLAHILSRLEFNRSTKQLIVDLPPRVRRQILEDLGIESKDPLNLAKGYIRQLVKAGLIKSIGGGSYVVDPESYGYSGYVPKDLRAKASAVYQEITHGVSGSFTKRVKVIDANTGEVIEVLENV